MEIEIIKFLQSGANEFWDVFFIVITYMASFFAFLFVTIIFFLMFNKKYTLFMAISFVVCWGINELMKLIFARPRPFNISTEIVKKVNASNYSMPSGHSFAVVFLVGWILYYIFTHTNNKYKKIFSTILGIIIIILVGISRMYLGVHYLSDVIVGFTYGLLCVITTIVLFKKFSSKNKYKGIKKHGN